MSTAEEVVAKFANDFCVREALDAGGRRYKPARYATIRGSKTALEVYGHLMDIFKNDNHNIEPNK